MKNFSKQRQVVLETLIANPVHPTAEELHALVQAKLPGIGIATVYRNLRALAEAGVILRLDGADTERYDGNPKDHAHFYCETCKRVTDISLPTACITALKKVQNSPFQLTFKGICGSCEK
ncbi:MAG: transcriptional repressor [Clostridiales bacterium]|nr:transcriptional repressor [Clostridiales bacterium]